MEENPYSTSPPPVPPQSAPAPGQLPPQIPHPSYYAVPQAGPYPVMITEDDRTLGMLCHLLAIFTGFIGPLILWLVKKDTSPYIDHHGRESLNFQLTLLILIFGLGLICIPLMLLMIGFFLLPLVALLPIVGLIFEILACVAANRGELYRYPVCFRIV